MLSGFNFSSEDFSASSAAIESEADDDEIEGCKRLNSVEFIIPVRAYNSTEIGMSISTCAYTHRERRASKRIRALTNWMGKP